MTLLDRLLLRSFFKAYMVCLISFLSLYIVVDLFTNLEDFAGSHRSLGPIVEHIAFYYGYKVTQIFDRLCEAIVLIAAAFTVAWMQRSNELVPLLSAGVSTQRVVRPLLLGSVILLGLSVANQEWVIPQIGNRLMNDRDDPNGEKPLMVQGAFEPNGIHIEGETASRTEGMLLVHNMYVVIPENLAGCVYNITAQEGRYIPHHADGPHRGGWLLTQTQPADLREWKWNQPGILEVIDEGKFFLHTQEVDFDTITRSRTWYTFASTARLFQELSKPDSSRMAPMAVLFHMRLTRLLVGMILVLAGVSVILRDQNRNIFLSTGLCLILCGLFFAAQFTCKSLGDNEYLSPALAAWIPVLTFGPLSLALFDAVHT
jgi:lipopolysaccharide export system permease protein